MSDLVAEPEHKEIEKDLRQMGSMSLLQHLEELRKCIIRSAAAVAIGFGVCWYFVLGRIPANAETYGHGGRGPDDAFAQPFQMLQQAPRAHLAQVLLYSLLLRLLYT